jgi:hypothetical protein
MAIIISEESKEEACEYIKKFETLKGDRKNWDNHWDEVTRYVLPRKNDIWMTRVSGEKKDQGIYDATAVHANELLASALHSMLTNPSTFWFGLTTGDDEIDKVDECRRWLQSCEKRMHQTLNNSNFQTEVHEFYLDITSIGTGFLLAEEDDEDVVRFVSKPIYENHIDENNKGNIDTVYREFLWTFRQIVQEFGEPNLPQFIMDRAESDPHAKARIIHCIKPRESYNPKNPMPEEMPFESNWIYVEQPFILRESGYKEQPFSVTRWTKTSGEKYGRSPAMKALPDIKMINEIMKTTIRGAQKVVDPPLLAPDDGVILPIDTRPGGINYYRAGTGDKIEPLITGSRIDVAYQIMDDIRKRIRDQFYIDQLQLNEGPQMTATEVMQRTEEKLRLLGPILGRMHYEFLRPIIDRVFNILMRKGMFPAIPDLLRGINLEVRFTSMIAKAQLASDSANVSRVFSMTAPLFQLDPAVKDNIDTDAMFRYVANMFGIPQTTLRDQADVNKTREQRQQEMQRMQQMQQEQHDAQVAGQVAPLAKVAQGQQNV